MLTKIRRILKKEDGSTTVVAAFAMVVLISMMAMVVDMGMAYHQQSSLQTAVDSAALAAASMLPDTQHATELANEYIIKNGQSPSDVSIHFQNNNSMIKISASKKVELGFARIFNINNLDINAEAKASKEGNGPFTYAIFSGSSTARLTLGGRFHIDGSVHTNSDLRVDPGSGILTGNAEASQTVYINTWTATVGQTTPNAPHIDMIDFTPYVNTIIPEYYSTILTPQQVNSQYQKQYFYGNTKVTGSCTISNQAVIEGNLYVDGNLTINGGAPVCVLSGSIYVTGNITMGNSLTFGATFRGNGGVFAKGNILFQGGQTEFPPEKLVFIYSETGNISFTAGSTQTTGIVYAPKGKVNIQGGKLVFNGSIVANEITNIPADLTVGKPNIDMPFDLKESRVKLIG